MDTSSILQTIPSQCGDYGEILVADAFHGEKKGYAQPCYDVESTESYVRAGLRRAGASPAPIDSCLTNNTDTLVRIEVKCKLARTSAGKASVIHCRNKLVDVQQHSAATHFAVILFDGGGSGIVEEAWLFTASTAELLRSKDTKSGYIPVASLRNAASTGAGGLINIRTLIEEVATSELSGTG